MRALLLGGMPFTDSHQGLMLACVAVSMVLALMVMS